LVHGVESQLLQKAGPKLPGHWQVVGTTSARPAIITCATSFWGRGGCQVPGSSDQQLALLREQEYARTNSFRVKSPVICFIADPLAENSPRSTLLQTNTTVIHENAIQIISNAKCVVIPIVEDGDVVMQTFAFKSRDRGGDSKAS
jgi:hypothetical protein